MKRRDLLRGLSLGLATPLLEPLVGRLVREAHGQPSSRIRLIVFTDGNGWGHQGMDRNSELLSTRVRSETDWDLPEVLSAFAPFADKVTIARRFQNPGGLHGSGWGTLSGVPGDASGPASASIDRLVAQRLGGDDAFSSVAFGVSTRRDRPPPCTSADGLLQPFPAFGSPTEAHRELFGGGGVEGTLRDRSLLDRMVSDIGRAQSGLAPTERHKLDQVLSAYRGMEQQLARRQAIFDQMPPPDSPGIEGGSLSEALIHAHADLIVQAFRFGLTHVAHLSVLGFDAHNVGWGFLGFGGDAHEQVAHISGGYDRARSTAAYRSIIDFKAKVIARMHAQLAEIPSGDGSLADETLFLWVNSGGGKHHHGSGYNPFVLIGDAGGRLKRGHFLEFRHHISEGYLAVAQALGVEVDCFGDPDRCQGPAPLLA